MYYAQIMDVMSQHHPEYVSLVWGLLKFIFVVRLSNFDDSLPFDMTN